MVQHILSIDALDAEGRGVGHLANQDGSAGKTVFVEGALPGETVLCETVKRKSRWELAKAVAISNESVLRVRPKCPYFGICGGCSMQHLEPSAQVAVKQRVLEDNLMHIGQVKPQRILPAVYGPYWGYRYRARLSVNFVLKKGGILIGFHERQSRYVADMKTCCVLPAHISNMLVPLRNLIGSLSIFQRVPQIEVAVGHDGQLPVTAFLLRIMDPLLEDDERLLKNFADQYHVQWWLQTKGPDTISLFYPEDSRLLYRLPEFSIDMPFKPGDFTQVNYQINQVLVSRAVRFLEIKLGERIADLFCGLGNFSLPIAKYARETVGIEGSPILTARAKEAASLNGLQDKTRFETRNLFEMTAADWVALGSFDKVLIDPPRDGAAAVCQSIAALRGEMAAFLPKRIVYVSCNPSTLARDAQILTGEGKYCLAAAGVVNMFPHTSHVESMAIFDRNR